MHLSGPTSRSSSALQADFVERKVCLFGELSIVLISICICILTRTTESLAAIARMSAQDTTPGHAFSTAVFILSMTSNPLAEFKLAFAVFSPVKLEVSSKSNEPSQP